MQKMLSLMLVILFLAGCATYPQTQDKLYPDVKVSRLLRVIDGDTFACDIDEHSAIAGKNISIRLRGINTPELKSRNEEERKFAIIEKQRDILSTGDAFENFTGYIQSNPLYSNAVNYLKENNLMEVKKCA